MEKTDKKKYPSRISTTLLLILYGALSIGQALATTEFSHVDPNIIKAWWWDNPAIIGANALLIFLFMVFIHGIFQKIQIPIGLATILVLGFSLATQMKIANRHEPIFFADMVLAREALGIVIEGEFLDPNTLKNIGIGLGIILILCFLPIGKYKLDTKTRIAFVLFPLVLSFFSLKYIYSTESPFFSYFPTRDKVELNKSLTFQDQGILFSFLTYRDVNKVEKPSPFVNNTVAEYKRAFTSRDSKTKPDIVMVMGEAWSDLSNLEGFDFYQGEDPFSVIENIEEGMVKRGQLIVPSFGGGTSNTEYDALTGNATLLLSNSSYSAYSAIRKPQESLARTLSDMGYNNYAFHPGNEWFYNRRNVYGYLGFKDCDFLEDMDNPEMKGSFVSEKAGADFFLSKVKGLEAQEAPYFAFYVTIQNHSPFDRDKYEEDLDSFEFKGSLSEEEKTSLEVYFEGIRDMNREMVRMIDQLADSPRPTIFFYFGDHLPSLVGGMNTLKKVGIKVEEGTYDGTWMAYKVPYLFWGNKAYWETQDQEIAYPERMSSNYIPSLILESMGAEDVDPFFRFSYDMRKDLPVLHRFFYFDENGQILQRDSHLNPEQRDMDEVFRTWQYLRAK